MNFELLYKQYADLVYTICLNYLQNSADAADATQEIFVKIYRNLASFKGNSSPKTWIYRISINYCKDVLKSKKRKHRLAYMRSLFAVSETLNNKIQSFDHPGIILEQKEATAALFKQINKLPANQKTALILSKIDGLSYQEVAQIMQKSPKSVESLVQRAKKNLKNSMNTEG